MNTMNMPGFTAERVAAMTSGRYRSGRPAASRSDAVIPAIPICQNCDYILDDAKRTAGVRARVCNACAVRLLLRRAAGCPTRSRIRSVRCPGSRRHRVGTMGGWYRNVPA